MLTELYGIRVNSLEENFWDVCERRKDINAFTNCYLILKDNKTDYYYFRDVCFGGYPLTEIPSSRKEPSYYRDLRNQKRDFERQGIPPIILGWIFQEDLINALINKNDERIMI